MRNLKLSFLFAAALLLNFACVEEKETGDQAPDLPPVSTMEFSSGDFSNNPSGGRVATATYVNFGNAVTNVTVWSALLAVHLVVPVAAFKKAAEQDPVFDEENSMWVWTYSFTAGSITYTAELTAKFVSAGVQWDMYISKSGEYENVHWFSGTSNLSATEGEWHLNYMPLTPTPFIDIEWSRESNNSAAQVKYINAIPENENNGSYIEYGFDSSLEPNAFYNIYLTSTAASVEIQWDTETKEGKIKNTNFFGTENFYCWNTALEDITCP